MKRFFFAGIRQNSNHQNIGYTNGFITIDYTPDFDVEKYITSKATLPNETLIVTYLVEIQPDLPITKPKRKLTINESLFFITIGLLLGMIVADYDHMRSCTKTGTTLIFNTDYTCGAKP